MICVFPCTSLNSQPNIGFRSLFSSLKLMGIVGLRRQYLSFHWNRVVGTFLCPWRMEIVFTGILGVLLECADSFFIVMFDCGIGLF